LCVVCVLRSPRCPCDAVEGEALRLWPDWGTIEHGNSNVPWIERHLGCSRWIDVSLPCVATFIDSIVRWLVCGKEEFISECFEEVDSTWATNPRWGLSTTVCVVGIRAGRAILRLLSGGAEYPCFQGRSYKEMRFAAEKIDFRLHRGERPSSLSAQ
jgi:hypothetical protein